jgi:hypothetical protein
MKKTIEIDVPTGYEISGQIMTGLETISFNLIKVEPKKDFEWYVKKYLVNEFLDKVRLGILFHNNNWQNIPFEIKIGLLKFICDNNGLSFRRVLHELDSKLCFDKFDDSIKRIALLMPKRIFRLNILMAYFSI